MDLLKGKVALITGSRQGLGRTVAELFLGEGAHVAINGRNKVEVEAAVSDLKSQGYANVMAAPGNVARQLECFAMCRSVIKEWGKIDVLVNNATDSALSASEDLDCEDWERVLGVNLSGSFYCSQAAAKLSMIEQRSGSIIMISSILGLGGSKQRAAYCSAKHGMIGLSKALAVEWGVFNIRVNALCPSNIMTPLEKEDAETGRCGYTIQDIERRTPLGRYSTPLEQAKACLWLASQDSSFTTGSVINTDGGWSAYMGI